MDLKSFGIKNTRQRADIVEVLKAADLPMSAEEIYRHVEDMSLSTVYRTLELLYGKNVVQKEHILGTDKMYYEISDGKHRHYAVCLDCGKLRKVEVCPVNNISVENFTVTDHKLALYGYCSECAKKHEKV